MMPLSSAVPNYATMRPAVDRLALPLGLIHRGLHSLMGTGPPLRLLQQFRMSGSAPPPSALSATNWTKRSQIGSSTLPRSRYSSLAPSSGVTRGGKAKRPSRFWELSLCTPFARSYTSSYLSLF